ncbi:probable 2-carboxy-D-arabinitol-1-phosphatase isoform X2 [Beta vulgaris subsp. vulgaris]|uniref:probable 2-carboxy-D-arabinitol-1-phosphatase isoform X2 n=1 Tax=Beta vulgaris subsp. vulgaris TaxID=3555 RepID=UPI00203674AD|nr:probable 2-carboxy-D-arabinitol-1-phosphatase isoform X2 [Beta vulgaris subsp. vulgaris]XP_057250298.1 probable 2-carboxy-D-arabinitol-1-phosphatase isoform X2 [Beta vulgaris subsp. vulgaris]XP_057250299.1 probable 2-carboxy-D-arabinitol-1-phosphatase isoform X2 [Beta vulgaris subsp. vulgaris]
MVVLQHRYLSLILLCEFFSTVHSGHDPHLKFYRSANERIRLSECPLARSKRTAEIIWGNHKEPMIPDFDLREIDLYSFQGLLKHEGKEKFGTAFRQWQLDVPNFIIDGHYPVRELWARARSSWDNILNHQSKSVLVVAHHNAVNQALVATAIGLGTEYFRVYLRATVVLVC